MSTITHQPGIIHPDGYRDMRILCDSIENKQFYHLHVKAFFLLLIAGALLVFPGKMDAQDARLNTTNAYFELGGAAIFLSGNLERVFPVSEFISFSGRVGLGMYPSQIDLFGNESKLSAVFPVTASCLFGKSLLLETGFGVSIGLDDAEDAYGNQGPAKFYTAILGLRYQPLNKSLLLRTGYTPYIIFQEEPNINGFIGLSIGKRLSRKEPVNLKRRRKVAV